MLKTIEYLQFIKRKFVSTDMDEEILANLTYFLEELRELDEDGELTEAVSRELEDLI